MKHCFALALTIIAVLFCGCTKDEKSTTPSVVTEAVDYRNTLVTKLPADTLAFVHYDTTSSAFKKLRLSPWASGSQMFDVKSLGDSKVQAVFKGLAAAGLDLSKTEVWEQFALETAVFATNQGSGNLKSLGFVVRSKDGFGLSKYGSTLKSELEKAGNPVSEFKPEKGEGFSFVIESKNKEGKVVNRSLPLYVAWLGNVSILSPSAKNVQSVVSSKGDSLPKVLESELYKTSIKDFPGRSTTYLSAVADPSRISATLNQASGNADYDFSSPESVLAFHGVMKTTPEAYIRLNITKESKLNEWISPLSASKAEAVVNRQSTKPLAFISLDGSVIRTADKRLSSDTASPIAFLSKVTRVALSAEVAPVGTSLLPVPDLSFIFETADPKQLKEDLKKHIEMALAASGMVQPWMTKQVAGVDVAVMQSPLGIGAFLAEVGTDSVVLASSASKVKQLLTSKDKSFASLSIKSKNKLLNEASFAQFVVDFNQLASMLSNVGGLMNMYAPDAGADDMLKKEQIENLRKMGVLVGSAILEENGLFSHSYYEAPKLENQK